MNALKYQNLLNELGLNECPANNCFLPKEEILAFRFSYDPIDNEHNFLPNYLIDQIVHSPFDYENCPVNKKCLRCGASYFTNLEEAILKWNKLTPKFKENYKYTHVSEGMLGPEDGLMNVPDKNHFTFYQFENTNLANKFQNLHPLQ